jgi:hypothetical protein
LAQRCPLAVAIRHADASIAFVGSLIQNLVGRPMQAEASV